MSNLLNNVVKEWSKGTLELGSEVMYPQIKYVHFDLDGIKPSDFESLKEEFEYESAVDFNSQEASYYRLVPTKIVGATLVFKNKPQFDIEGVNWSVSVDVDKVLEGVDFEEYQLYQNKKFDRFMLRLKELKEDNSDD